MRLIHAGLAVADLVLRVPDLPGAGTDVPASGGSIRAGGGVTVMRVAAGNGLPTLYAGGHGTGPFGDVVRGALLRAGVALAQAPVADRDTGVSVTLVEPSGQRSFVTLAGAETALGPLDGLTVDAQDLIYVSGYALAANPDRLTAWLSTVPGRLFVDAGPRTDTLPERVRRVVLARASWWSLNEDEANTWTGIEVARDAATALAAQTPATVIVRTGAAGCVLAGPGRARTVPAPAAEVVDTTGAGDTWAGAFLAAVARDESLFDAARVANGAAAASLGVPGPGPAE